MDPYATHLRALIETVLETSGPVLELGCGDYSTPLLKAVCAAQKRHFKAMAANAEWGARFGAEIVDWDSWKPEGVWGMVFLDNEESTANRIRRIPALLAHTDVIVLHDADTSSKHKHWNDCVQGWTVNFFAEHTPATAVLRKNVES